MHLIVQGIIWTLTLMKCGQTKMFIHRILQDVSCVFAVMSGMYISFLGETVACSRYRHLEALYIGIILSNVKVDPPEFYRAFYPSVV
jgi:hypothetical protein